ncbi:MAG: hypothetical protein ACK4QL_07870 [Pseudanabaenaceae cyanobacterium]
MEVQKLISQRRVYHIIDSYQLLGNNPDPQIKKELDALIDIYPHAYLEIALVECLVRSWSIVPLPRGKEFIGMVRQYLVEAKPISITSAQFRQITGLEPLPITSLVANFHADVQP